MRILLITQILPYPPDAGPRVKTWHVLRHLSGQGHQVTLASFVRPHQRRHLPMLETVCAEVLAIPMRRSRLRDLGHWLRAWFTGRPFLVERDRDPAMWRAVNDASRRSGFDVVHADQLTMAQYAAAVDGDGPLPVRVFDAHNANVEILDRMRTNAAWWMRGLLAMEARRIRRYEGGIVRTFDHTLAVTDGDRQALLQAAGNGRGGRFEADRVSVIPIAVDTQACAPTDGRAASRAILALGTLHYAPNAEGIRWFLRQVFPRVRARLPEVQLTIVGPNPPADFQQAAEEAPDAIRVTGYVEDLTLYWSEAALTVVPVLSGSGMRVRILEALARGVPTVTTTIGLEGIEAQDGVQVLVADDPDGFAEAVVRLLKDEPLRARLAAAGRRLAVERYDWRSVLRRLDDLYQSRVPRSP